MFGFDFDISFIPSLSIINIAFISAIKVMAIISSRLGIVKDGLIRTRAREDIF